MGVGDGSRAGARAGAGAAFGVRVGYGGVGAGVGAGTGERGGRGGREWKQGGDGGRSPLADEARRRGSSKEVQSPGLADAELLVPHLGGLQQRAELGGGGPPAGRGPALADQPGQGGG